MPSRFHGTTEISDPVPPKSDTPDNHLASRERLEQGGRWAAPLRLPFASSDPQDPLGITPQCEYVGVASLRTRCRRTTSGRARLES
jgi:hypothetical protein